jgi:hypothetical protein
MGRVKGQVQPRVMMGSQSWLPCDVDTFKSEARGLARPLLGTLHSSHLCVSRLAQMQAGNNSVSLTNPFYSISLEAYLSVIHPSIQESFDRYFASRQLSLCQSMWSTRLYCCECLLTWCQGGIFPKQLPPSLPARRGLLAEAWRLETAWPSPDDA